MTTARDTYNQIVYAREQGHAKGLEEGEAKGRKEGEKIGEVKGRKEKELEIARKMLAMGLDVNTIAAATDLTPQEIEALKEPTASE